MQISSQTVFYLPTPLSGGAMFYRCHPRQAPDADAFASSTRSLKQEADAASAIYLWCRGRLQHGRIDRPAVKRCLHRLVVASNRVNTLDAARFTRIYLNSIR
jgi:hypothetical protein